MTDRSDLPDAWDVWSSGDDGRLVFVYRPDVFDTEAFPAACLPTLYVTHGRRTRRPGRNPNDATTGNDWFVTLYLEPDVTLEGGRRFSTRSEALDCAVELARLFDAGEIEYRDRYQVPRERYLDRLDELTGRTDDSPDHA